MTSEALPLSIRSDPDAQITIFDSAGVERSAVSVGMPILLPRGLYRIRLERCGFVHEELILHDSASPRELDAPLVESPAPIDIAADSGGHASIARRLSVREAGSGLALGDGPHDARLFVFVRRMSGAVHDTVFPSEPVSVRDLTGRRLAMLAPDPVEQGRDLQSGYIAMTWKVTPGSYRLRVGHSRRDLTITIPVGRAAYVFLADRGTISLRTARVYLPQVDAAFDPGDGMACAMESVLWALSQPGGELPPIAHRHLPQLERDLSFGIACAHVLRRQGDRAVLEQVMRALTEHAPRTPDVEILSRAWQGQSAPSGTALTLPPLFRASFVLALEDGMPVGPRSALVEAAKAAHGDSVWCTWSPRWWDERWIAPTVDRWRSRRDGAPATVEAIARATRLPAEVVEQALLRLDAASPRVAGSPASVEQISVPGYALRKQLGRGERSTVYAAHRTSGGGEVALKIIPAGAPGVTDADARALDETLARFAHPRLLASGGTQVLPDGSALCLELELCRESLFDRLASRGRPLSYDEACAVVLQALEALGALHDRGLVHGNIHPGNLFIRMDGTAVLGLPAMASLAFAASAASASGSGSDRTRFLAPECVGEGGACSAASDTWSVAATLYFLVTLELPRERYTDQGEVEAARANAVAPIADRLSDLPAALVDCIGIALSAPPARRFGDGKALQDALRSAAPAARAVVLHDELVRRDPAYAATLRNVFLRLTTLTRGAPAWVARDDLQYDDAAENERVQHTLDRFQVAGLIATGTDADDPDGADRACVRLAHSELLHGWTRIRTWRDELDDVPGARGLLIELRDEARAWHANHPDSSLWGRERILLAERVRRDGSVTYSALEDEFLRRSRSRLARRDAAVSVGALALAMLFLVLAWRGKAAVEDTAVASTDRDQALSEARSAQTLVRLLAPSLQEIGRQRLLDGRPFQALPYFVEAGRAGNIPPSLRMLFGAASRNLSLDHRDTVVRAAFDRTGSRVVTASRDGTARIWNALTGERIALLRHEAAVTSAVFSPDGTRIVTASEDRTAQIWDANGHRVCPPLQHGHFVLSAAFSPDGKHVVTASLDHSARIWDAATGAREHELSHGDAVWTASFSPDGKRVVTASWDHTARIWDAATGAAAGPPLAHQDLVWSAAFSPDGTRVVTASQDKTAQLWDAATGKPVGPVLQHGDGVTSATFDAKGRYVVTTSWDDRAQVWDAGSGAPVSPPLVHRGAVVSAAFSPDGARVITASSDGAARIWDTVTGQLVHPPLEQAGPVTGAAFSADGTRAITASADRTARVWDAISDRPPVALDFSGEVRSAAFSPDGGRMVAVTGDNLARIFDTATGKLVGPALVHQAAVRTAVFSPDGRSIATASDRVVQIWDAVTARMLTAPLEHPGRVTSVTFSPDGAQVITTSGDVATRRDDTLRIWNARTGVRTAVSLAYPDRFVSAWMSSDGTRLVTLNQEQKARIWDATTGAAITPPLDQRNVTSVAFSPDGSRVVTASEDPDDHTARVWDAASGKLLVPPLEHHDRVASASFSPEGARILTVSHDRTVRVWDATTGNPLTPPLHQGAPIVAAAFSADRSDANRSRILSVDGQALRTWDVSLDPRSLEDWSNIVDRGPYVLQDGVLMLRSLAANAQLGHRPRPRKPSS